MQFSAARRTCTGTARVAAPRPATAIVETFPARPSRAAFTSTRIMETTALHDQRCVRRRVIADASCRASWAGRNPGPRRKECAPNPPAKPSRFPRSKCSASAQTARRSNLLPLSPAMWLTACTIPCSTLISFLLTATRSVSVAAMYITPEMHAAPRHGAGKVFCGSSNFVAHHRRELQPHQARSKSRRKNSARIADWPEYENPRPSPWFQSANQTIRPSPISTAAATPVPMPPTLLIHFPTPRPTMFRTTSRASRCERRHHREGLIVGQPLVAGPEREHRHAHEIEHHRRNVHHVVGPIAPAGQEPVEVAEDFLGPQINAAFTGIAMRQLDHRNSLRPEKKNE